LSGGFIGYATEIRVRNDSKIDFENVIVGGKNYGDIKRGAVTDYQTWEKAYGYSLVSLLADSKPLKFQPDDYVGEAQLGDGHFTYVLTIQDGRLDIRAEEDKIISPAQALFSILPPITNANPSIRHPISIRVPTQLKIERTTDTLSMEIATNSFESTNLMVGTNMVTGVESKVYVYAEGESRPANGGYGLGGTDFNLGTSFWHTKQEGIPLPGKKYVVELELAVFETDIPPQHMWSPQGSKNFKVLWRRTLKQTVE
jgi:hypothetical protein